MLVNAIRWLFQTQPLSIDPALDTLKFLQQLESSVEVNSASGHIERKELLSSPSSSSSSNGSIIQYMTTGSYRAAIHEANTKTMPLLIYLHSPLHEDTDVFISQVLCSSSFKAFVSSNAVLWAGSILDPEAYSLVGILGAVRFPFVAVLHCQSDRNVEIIDRIQSEMSIT